MLDEPVKAIVDNSNKKDEVKKATKQGSIMDMFARQAKRRKSEEKENRSGESNGVTSSPASKKAKVFEIKTENATFKSTMKCKQCRQLLEDVDLYPGDNQDASEEFIALTHESLSLFVGNDESGRPQHKITNFCVYDKSSHVVSFDAGLIEKNIELFFSGVIKPVYEEDMSLENGVYGTRLGPINEWWTTGFDGGEKALVGFSTAFCDYILVEPHPLYATCWNTVQEKIYMSKIVIEFLCDNEAAVYEDLLNYIQNTVPPEALELSRFTEDSLLRHAQFVCEQVESFDDARKEDDDRLMANPCMRDLIHLAGVTVGKRKAARRGVVKEKKAVKASSTKATTTPLVASVMESFFSGTVDIVKSLKPRLSKCGVCENCQRPNCGVCTACKDMKVFGGSGRSKQACHERKCMNMVYADDIEQLDEEDEQSDKEIEPLKKVKHSKIMSPTKLPKKSIKWSGEIIKTEKSNNYYETVIVGDESISIGDSVTVIPDDVSRSLCVGKICALWENTNNLMKNMHIDWFLRGNETVLGETAEKGELFLCDDCEETEVRFIYGKVDVEHKAPHDNWHSQGGVLENNKNFDNETTFFYQKWFGSELARFVDPPIEIPASVCQSCARKEKQEYDETPHLGNPTKQENGKMFFESVTQNGVTYKIEDSVYLPVDSYDFDAVVPVEKKKPKKSASNVDEKKYPEVYRKTKHVKGSNENVPEPFKIGCISSIYQKVSDKKSEVYLEVIKFYRPGDTHKGPEFGYYKDLNLLYYSNEKAKVKFSEIRGKCFVQCEFDIEKSLQEYMASGPDRFYFNEMYDAKTESFEDPPPESRRLGKKTQKKMVKMTKQKAKNVEVKEEEVKLPKFNKLKTLDVFAGCGGLSEGFHQAGIAESRYAIELWEPAAQAYKLNNPGTTVFTEDCNVLLESVMQGKEKSRCGQTLPQKGDVELLCGGPPCQGFSGMNRFNSREYSKFKNSLVVSYLSYCDYYRPRFFLLENVRNFVSFKNCMVLKLALSSLIKMGYQCTFGVLQAGHYGVAQTRRRAIILAAAPGEQLPLYPEPLHTFSLKSGSLTVQVDDLMYKNNITRTDGAPFRTITVRDTMSDLPHIKNGHNKVEIPYQCDNTSHFQRMISNGANQTIVRDHICKDMSALVEARMKHIPLVSGSDWRDLPNIQVKLSDGTMTKLLRYTANDIKQGKSGNGDLRGVCACAEGSPCDPMDRQFNTLIPWCLPHTGNRHNHWAGLYGRLEWDGFFSTTVTNPEPMGKQGRVLHPEQNRVVSVRECARSQGFPDNYRFYGSVLDKHRQVGNAVPPPMAKAIGMEIKKCLLWKAAQEIKEEK